jgi:predicted nucleic acid-binding protein
LTTQKAIELIRTYHLSHGLLIADALIAATAITLQISLATKNHKDYRFIESLKLKKYP